MKSSGSVTQPFDKRRKRPREK